MENFFNPEILIKTLGYAGFFAVIFAESGLFFGFILPGDSLLFTAGFLASQGYVNMAVLIFLCFLGAVLGDNVGYAFGRKIGPKIFTRENSFFFNKKYIEQANLFFENHGARTLILARFVPTVRTFAPILAGVGNMHYKTFLFFNIIGAALWPIVLIPLGYFLGRTIPGVDKYILPIVIILAVISVLPVISHFLKNIKKSIIK